MRSELRRKTRRCALARRILLPILGLTALAGGAPLAGAAEGSLTLSEALARTIASNPGLKVFDLRRDGLAGRRISADQDPALEVAVDAENFLGRDDLRGVAGAEYTLSLSSELELGHQRQARVAVVTSRAGLVEAERRAETLQLLAQVTRSFVVALALQEKLDLAADAVALAETTHAIVARRAGQGAVPQAEVLRSRAALTQSHIEQARQQAAYESRKMALATLWGDNRPDFRHLAGDLYAFGSSDSFEDLYQRASESPAVAILASEARIREAEFQLARSQSAGDLRWEVGARRHEATDDLALVAGLSVPLFPGQRNRGEVQAARAAREEVRYRRDETLLHLRARLFEAWHLRQHSIEAVVQMRDQVLPDLTEALDQTRDAYQRGRYSYPEWLAAQRELLSARRALVDAATTALLNQTLIEQLTAEPLAGTAVAATR